VNTDRVTIAARLAEVTERIEAAAGGRAVTVIGVTKAFGAGLLTEAAAAGLTDLGENYAQEVQAKVGALGWVEADRPAVPRLHFIGGLQRNKIKRLAPWIHLWQTVDRAALVDTLATRVPGTRVLIQVNTTGEPQKSGCRPDEAAGLVERAVDAGLGVSGLMTIGPTDPDADPRPGFVALRTLVDRLGLTEASMGMSADYEAAVAEGATMVRLGSVLFGSRPIAPMPTPPTRPSPTGHGGGK
jgi:pyridoxal phosphate enzyme (YggS family)